MNRRAASAVVQCTLACAGLLVLANVIIPRHEVKAASAPVHAEQDPIWRRDIAPILYKNCTSCHHTGGSGPFPLTTYEEAKRWGTLIQAVTATRYMPPWLPEPGHVQLQGDRRLNEADIAAIKHWVETGMKEGEGSAPAVPAYGADWQLGKPDLVIEMKSPLEVPADGQDLFMNFALPVEIKGTRWVRAMEIKPGAPQLVHHANVIIDRTASLRRAHPDSWRSGVPGMDLLVDSGDAFDPDSHFLFWKPDSTALVEPATMPWRLDPGNDLVLNMHLKPTGKVEQVKARIALYFSDKPATDHPMLLQLEHDDALDIPAGDKDFVIEDSLKLPVAVELLGLYPHAHYLGKRLEGWVTLPGGQRQSLILIRDWDIDRQSVYRLAKPLPLPKGTVVHMRYTYDNSSGNVRNPNTPAIRVKAGNRSVDEMGHLWLQVLPQSRGGGRAPDPRVELERAWMENRLGKQPNDPIALYNLASVSMMSGDASHAAELYQHVLQIRPDDVRTLTSLGAALAAKGDWHAAQAFYRSALARDASYSDAIFDLGQIDLAHGEFTEAETLLRRYVGVYPDDAQARAYLGATLAAEDKGADAAGEFDAALKIDAGHFDALYGLGKLDLEAGDASAAEPLLLRAAAAKEDGAVERLLAMAYAKTGDADKAVPHLQLWQRLEPGDTEPHRALAQVYGSLGRLTQALAEQQVVVKMEPGAAADWNDLGVLHAQLGDKPAARVDFQRALRLDPGSAQAADNLARLPAP